MRIIQIDINKDIRIDKPIAACIGYFDGLHIGHKALIDKTLDLARQYNLEPSLITFDPDPWVTIKDLVDVKHLTTMKQRINLAAKFGIKNIIILKFTKAMANLSFQDFEEKILGKCNINQLVCGFDFHYGRNGEGNSLTLKACGIFDVEIIDSINYDNEKISTTRIAKILADGNIKLANALLGYNYEIQGKIIKGNQKGSTIGFPTANILPEFEYFLPKTGVYACFINIQGKKYKSMVNIGHNPTFNYVKNLSIEAHIVDFNSEIYGMNVSLEFIEFLREERKFNNIDNLILQLEQDLFNTKRILNNE